MTHDAQRVSFRSYQLILQCNTRNRTTRFTAQCSTHNLATMRFPYCFKLGNTPIQISDTMRAAPHASVTDNDSQALPAVPERRARHPVTPILALWPTGYRGRHAELLAFFQHRASWSASRAWNDGRRPMPQWARDLLKNELERRIAEYQNVLDILDGR